MTVYLYRETTKDGDILREGHMQGRNAMKRRLIRGMQGGSTYTVRSVTGDFEEVDVEEFLMETKPEILTKFENGWADERGKCRISHSVEMSFKTRVALLKACRASCENTLHECLSTPKQIYGLEIIIDDTVEGFRFM
jgi:hypothetical protein